MAIGKTKSVVDAHEDGNVVKYFGMILFRSFEKSRNVFCVGTLWHKRDKLKQAHSLAAKHKITSINKRIRVSSD
jgi:hypothetical protein